MSSPLEQDALNAKVAVERVVVLPNCVSLDEARKFERTYPEDETLQILFMGRISRQKGLDVILEALDTLQEPRPSVFGSYWRAKDLTRLLYVRRFGELLGNKFEFTGVVGTKERSQLLRRCNVFVLPSLFEGLPMALLESMSFGVVPITTDVGSISTVVVNQSNGLIIK